MHDTNTMLHKIKLSIEKQAHYQYIEKYIQKPEINDEKLFLLYCILNHVDLPQLKKNKYIMTVMLIQMALDTHDLVNNTENDMNEPVTIEQQLRVLTGDYYSSLYYLLLAELDDYQLVNILAKAIREINEQKIKLLYKEYQSYNELEDIIIKVEATLYTNIAEYVGETSLLYFIENWFLLIALQQVIDGTKLSIFDKMHISLNENNLREQIEQSIDEKVSLLEQTMLQLPKRHQLLKKHLEHYLYDLS